MVKVENLDEVLRRRAIDAAMMGDERLARERQEMLLSVWAGKSVMLDTPYTKPEDRVQGVWDSLRKAGIISPASSDTYSVVTASGERFYQEGQSDPYDVPVTYRHIPMKSDHEHIRGLIIDLVAFKHRGEEYLRVFRQYRPQAVQEGTDLETFLYVKDKQKDQSDGVWTQLSTGDVSTRDRRWLLEERQTEDFLLRAGRNHVRSNLSNRGIFVERFMFGVQPRVEDPAPKTQHPVLQLLRRTKAA